MSSQRSACHYGDVSRIFAPWGAVDSRVICSAGVGRVAAARVLPGLLKPAPARILPGLLKLAPGKDLAGGICFIPLLFVVLFSWALVPSSFGLTLAHLPCRAWCGGARGSDCPCTVIGVQKVYPSFCTPTHLLEVRWLRASFNCFNFSFINVNTL